MRIAHLVRPMLFVLLAAASPCFTGCRAYYPAVSVIPPPAFHEATSETHAFRVEHFNDGSGTWILKGWNASLCELLPGEQYFPQVGLYLDSKYFGGTYTLGMEIDSSHQLAVRLYRPGWQTVELHSWEMLPTVTWVKAESLREQEMALDTLMSISTSNAQGYEPISPTPEEAAEMKVRLFLEAGSTSAAHRSALLFGASEYDRLATLARRDPVDQAIQARLLKKAQMLRELAD
jgi:hypothetical protein